MSPTKIKKKRIAIIEDTEEDFKFLRGATDAFYDVFPPKEDDWNDLRGEISSRFDDMNRIEEKEKSRKFIVAQLKKYNAELFIIDYLLKEDNHNCNGLRFLKEFLFDKTILIITKGDDDQDNRIKNAILQEVSHPCNGNRVGIIYKEKLDDSFRQKFLARVNELLPYENGGDKPLDMKNIIL